MLQGFYSFERPVIVTFPVRFSSEEGLGGKTSFEATFQLRLGDNVNETVTRFLKSQEYNLEPLASYADPIFTTATEMVVSVYSGLRPIKDPESNRLPVVNSFDIFDTILVRRVETPHDIFTLVEQNFPFPNFRQLRVFAESQAVDGSVEGIYANFQSLFNVTAETADALLAFEIQTELENTYLIQHMYDLVSDGDILISDMYLPLQTIRLLLRNAGFNKSTNLYVSPGGKHHGWMWSTLTKNLYDIRYHRGDNFASDVVQAFNHGVQAEWTRHHLFSDLEMSLKDADMKELALFFREFRHGNPHPPNTHKHALYEEQAQRNLPALLLLAVDLKDILLKESITRVLLTTRDCCLVEKLFSALLRAKFFPPTISFVRFHTSRIAYLFPSTEFKNYLREVYVPGETIIVDGHGLFTTGRTVFAELFGGNGSFRPRVHLLSADWTYDVSSGPFLTATLLHRPAVETHNLDTVGQLLLVYRDEETTNHQARQFLRGPVFSYALEDAKEMHATVDAFCTDKYIPRLVAVLQGIESRRNAVLPSLRSIVSLAIGDLNSSALVGATPTFADFHRPIAASFKACQELNITPPIGSGGEGDVLTIELLKLWQDGGEQPPLPLLHALWISSPLAPSQVMSMSACLDAVVTGFNYYDNAQIRQLSGPASDTLAVALMLKWLFLAEELDKKNQRFLDMAIMVGGGGGDRDEERNSNLCLNPSSTSLANLSHSFSIVLETLDCGVQQPSFEEQPDGVEDLVARFNLLSQNMAAFSVHVLLPATRGTNSSSLSCYNKSAHHLSFSKLLTVKCCPRVAGKRCSYFTHSPATFADMFVDPHGGWRICFLWRGAPDMYSDFNSLSSVLDDVLPPTPDDDEFLGPILSSNQTSTEEKCTQLFSAIISAAEESIPWPPPEAVPVQLLPLYTLNGRIPTLPLYYAERQNGGAGYSWSRRDIEMLGTKPSHCGGYELGHCDKILLKYKKYVENKYGMVFGSQGPWAEAALLALGASHILTVEYMQIETDHPRLSTLQPSSIAKKYLSNEQPQADFVFSFSSLEHDGLGRYGDHLNPFGDLEAIARVHCLLKPGGIFFLGLPVGPDALVWNAHRIYGQLRLGLILAQWDPLDMAGNEFRITDSSKLGYFKNQPLWVLRKR